MHRLREVSSSVRCSQSDERQSSGLREAAIKAATVIANAGAFVMLVGIATAAVLAGPRSISERH